MARKWRLADGLWLLRLATLLQVACPAGQAGRLEGAAASKRPDERPSCADCRLTAGSLDELLRKPRQADLQAAGQLAERLQLEQLRKVVCRELAKDSERERCRHFYFSQQASVLEWHEAVARALPRGKLLSFHDQVCIRALKLCCPEASFGPKCSKCPQCGPNERCQGERTRTGNGTCVCRPGHAGPQCASCQRGFYLDGAPALKLSDSSDAQDSTSLLKSRPNEGRPLCKQCHRSCEHCRAPGPRGCELCRRGYSWRPPAGCLDVDECLQSGEPICGPNTFCVNTEGAHFCYECDRACDGCHGDGPDMCLKCAKNYRLDSGGNCAASRKSILPPEANYYRYAIYAGLCLSACIILHSNVFWAGLVGLAVSLYIGASEYIMSGQPGAPASAGPHNDWAAQLAGSLAQGNPFAHLGL